MRKGRPTVQIGGSSSLLDGSRCRGGKGNISIGFKIEANQFHYPALLPRFRVATYGVSRSKIHILERLHHNGGGASCDRARTDIGGNDSGGRFGFRNAGSITEANDCRTNTPWGDRPVTSSKLDHNNQFANCADIGCNGSNVRQFAHAIPSDFSHQFIEHRFGHSPRTESSSNPPFAAQRISAPAGHIHCHLDWDYRPHLYSNQHDVC